MKRPIALTHLVALSLPLICLGPPAALAAFPAGSEVTAPASQPDDTTPEAAPEATKPVSLSFVDAVTLLHERNQQLLAAAEGQRRREEEQAATRGLTLPRVDLRARTTQIDQPISIDLAPIRTAMLALHPEVPPAAIPPFETEIQNDRFFKAELELSWPLYTGGAIQAANRAADARLDDARQQSRGTQQELFADLVSRYYGLCLAEQARAVRRRVLDGMDRHLYQATRLEEEGMIARAERLHAEVARAEASRALQAAEQDVQLARAALRALLVVQGDLHPTSELFIVHDLPSLEELQRSAEDNNPDLSRLAAQQELARSALAAERAAYRPTVAVFAMHELHTGDLTILEPRWAAGIDVRFNLFDGNARGHRVEAARATAGMVEHLQEGARNDIALLVEHHYRTMLKAIEQFDSLSATVNLAEENLRVRTHAFEEGFATSLDVVDARTTLAGVRLARLAAAHEFVTALADLLAVTGHAATFEQYAARADVEVTS